MTQALLNYALYHEFDAESRISEAFASLDSANIVRKRFSGYDANLETNLADNYLEQLEGIEFGDCQRKFSDVATTSPIFIVGLPRTGSTLLEKHLSGLSDIFPVGEHMAFRKGIEQQSGIVLGSLFEIASVNMQALLNIDELGRLYRDRAEWRAMGHRYYTDKEPCNYMFCGFIAKALPDARIVHITRNPMDTCFSMFKQIFALGSFESSYSLYDLAVHYKNYSRVMAFWRKTLGSRMLEIRYEDLVLRNEMFMQKIKAYCQFPENDELTKSAEFLTSTLSAAQVRQPIHAGNINAWAKYAEFLKPLREQLDDEYVKYMSEIDGVDIL